MTPSVFARLMGRLRGILILAVLAIPLAGAGAVAPAFATVSGGAEPAIFVSPSGTVFVGDTARLHRSNDGGASWQTSPNPFLPGGFTDGWPMAMDATGTLVTATTQGQVIGVAASTNGGVSWAQTSSVVDVAGVADRPWVAARGNGEVVVLYYSAGLGEQCLYSTDGGLTFLTRSLVNEGPSNAGNAVFDAQGRVWYASGAYLVRWNAPCQGEPERVWIGGSGPQIFNQLAVSNAGDAYLALPTSNSGGMQIQAMHGTDRSTLKALTVSPANSKSNTFGAIAAKADGSEIAVAWYGSPTAGNPAGAFSGSWDVYIARVTNFWTASPTVAVTKVQTGNHVGGFCMTGISCTSGDRDLLDYMGIAYDNAGNVHLAYGHDGATSRAEVRYVKL